MDLCLCWKYLHHYDEYEQLKNKYWYYVASEMFNVFEKNIFKTLQCLLVVLELCRIWCSVNSLQVMQNQLWFILKGVYNFQTTEAS